MASGRDQRDFAAAQAAHGAGRLDAAEAGYRTILARDAANAGVQHLLGVLLHQRGRHDEAYPLVKAATSSGDAKVFNNLGEICRALGRRDEAVEAYRRATEIDPGSAIAHNNLGLALVDVGRFDQAMAAMRQAITLKPDYAKAYSALGMTLHTAGRSAEALDACLAGVKLGGATGQTLNNLGVILRFLGRLDDAVAAFREALRVDAKHAPAALNLGETLARQGDVAAGIASVRRALEVRPDYPAAWDSLLFLLHYSDASQEKIFAEHVRWRERYEAPLAAKGKPHDNHRRAGQARRLNGPLRVGYVSPDFRRHPIGYFMRPVVAHHDRQRVEVFCYSGAARGDAVTAFFKSRADGWRDVAALGDEELAELIRRDRIDVLVDLTLHMAHNRLMVFARKPAPVQVTYLGYPHTTGLAAMDYKLSDPHIDPPGTTEQFHSEKIVRLPETFFCAEAEESAPAVGALPAERNGFVTFGSMNTLMKISPRAIEAWSRIMNEVNNSHLLLVASGLGGEPTRARVREQFARFGVPAERIELIDLVGVEQSLAAIERADVALDSFPYSGGTTTWNSLWMGAPVVTLAGESPVGRQGVSFLTNAGLSELIAADVASYVRIAVELANDLPRLSAIRVGLRDRLRSSPIMEAKRFAGHVEEAYFAMWRAWCAL